MSTPTSLELPDGVRPTTVRTSRGSFAALEAVPVSGVCEREPALLVPGYTGSKEDFLAVLGQPEPEETYSTSEHLYAQLDIPREATGTLPHAMRGRAGLEAEAVEDIGETGRIRSPRARRGRGTGRSTAARTPEETRQASQRRRRRTRAGRELGASQDGPEAPRRKAS